MLEKILTTRHLPIWAEEYAQSVAVAYNPDCIILFGSVARGAQKQDSDIDILVVGGDLPAGHRERFRLLMRMRPQLAPIQVQTYTRAEWERMMADKHVTVLEALHDGIPLYGQDLFAGWRREFERWMALGLRRTNCTWSLPPVLRSKETALVGSDYVEWHRQWQDTLDAEQVFDEVFGPAGDSAMRS